jgi:hypothetical protein
MDKNNSCQRIAPKKNTLIHHLHLLDGAPHFTREEKKSGEKHVGNEW